MELYISGDEEDFLEAEPFFTESALDPNRSIDEVKEAGVYCMPCLPDSGTMPHHPENVPERSSHPGILGDVLGAGRVLSGKRRQGRGIYVVLQRKK